MKTLIIANPAAGNGRGFRRMAELGLDRLPWDEPPTVVATQAPGHAVELAARARREGYDLVVAAGGDGTVHEVVNGLLAEGAPGAPELAVLPLGTGCDFARNVGQACTPAAALAAMPTAPVRVVDVGRVTATDAAGGEVSRIFVNAVNVGLGPRVARRVRGSRWLGSLGAASYGVGAALVLLRFRHDELAYCPDGGEPWQGPALNVTVSNGAYCGGGMKVSDAAGLTTARLALVRLGAMKRLTALALLSGAVRGRAPRHAQVHGLECERLTLTGVGDLEVDGELPGRLPATFEILPRALRVRVPG